jgi:hypothetical protein
MLMKGGHCRGNDRLLHLLEALVATEVHVVNNVPLIFFEVLEKSYIGRVKMYCVATVFSHMNG